MLRLCKQVLVRLVDVIRNRNVILCFENPQGGVDTLLQPALLLTARQCAATLEADSAADWSANGSGTNSSSTDYVRESCAGSEHAAVLIQVSAPEESHA